MESRNSNQPENNMNRFEIPQTVQNLINKAVEIEMIDAVAIYEMASNHANNWNALINEITDIAYSNIHWNPDHHYTICGLADLHYSAV
jgi:hypothetical protein